MKIKKMKNVEKRQKYPQENVLQGKRKKKRVTPTTIYKNPPPPQENVLQGKKMKIEKRKKNLCNFLLLYGFLMLFFIRQAAYAF